jgi:hypothetical protein
MNDSDVMVVIIRWMLSYATNKEYKEKLNIILRGIEGCKHTEEQREPRFQSFLLFGINIFPFSKVEYRLMAEELLKENP